MSENFRSQPNACNLSLDLKHWVRMAKPQYRIARFILIAFYTGTRHEAILRLRWLPNVNGGWFDLDHGKLYRKGEGERESPRDKTHASPVSCICGTRARTDCFAYPLCASRCEAEGS